MLLASCLGSLLLMTWQQGCLRVVMRPHFVLARPTRRGEGDSAQLPRALATLKRSCTLLLAVLSV